MGSRARAKGPLPGPLAGAKEVTCSVIQVESGQRADQIHTKFQALEDLIMVSYTGPGDRLFQGVLLDATKRWEPRCSVSFCLFHHFSADLFLALKLWIAIVSFVLSSR